MKKAVYAGTFDPITLGHRDIVLRSLGLFDKLTVAVAENSSKQTLFTVAERTTLIREALADLGDKVEVTTFSGLLVDYAKKIGVSTIIRGLRAISDYEYEAQMALVNRELAPEVDTAFLMTSADCAFISSSIVKEIARNAGDASKFVPANVAAALKAKLTS
jgi:pantetheine-phosphate adenylyltransferase